MGGRVRLNHSIQGILWCKFKSTSGLSKWRFKILQFRRLYTTDTKALNHILMTTSVYQKPEAARHNLSRILGEGVLVVEGEKHKQQRKVMNPAFGPSQIRELTEIFVSKAIQLRDAWASENDRKDGQDWIDALSWLSRTTLDVIGLAGLFFCFPTALTLTGLHAGFNYKFDALSEDPKKNELNAAFALMFKAGTRLSLIPMIRAYFPFLRFLKTEQDVKAAEARKTMTRISHELLRGSKNSVHEKGEKRDLLTLLVKSNMDTDIPEHQRMSDQDVLAQIPTFLVAGHETTSTGTTWALYALTQDKAVQNKLREELFSVDTDNPTMDQLNALPYLDMVVRETLRVHSPVPSTIRIAVKDDLLPLGHPITDRKGVVHNFIKVTKGQMLFIPILAINRDKSIWGEDAAEFRPERWEHVPEAAANVPGVWGNMLTFLGGPRACIGYRFSLVETKALLFTLVRAFEFDLAVPAKDIIKKSSIVQRPVLVTDPDGSNKMPLLIRPIERS
ncbi:Secologanin synthase [Termitomyces sp. J132]|nr:Secologanin synthase [Termitomyces sp. J132]